MIDLLPCPLCEGEAEFERMGTGRVSCIIACTDCGLKLETGESGAMCGRSWNSRPKPKCNCHHTSHGASSNDAQTQ